MTSLLFFKDYQCVSQLNNVLSDAFLLGVVRFIAIILVGKMVKCGFSQ